MLQDEGLLEKKETGVAVLGELVRQLLTEATVRPPEHTYANDADRAENPLCRRPRHILMLSGGKDSTALAIYMRDRVPEMEYVFCDTDKELPETYEYLTKLEYLLGRKIERLRDDRGFDHWLTGLRGLPALEEHALVYPHAQDQAVREVRRRRRRDDVRGHPGRRGPCRLRLDQAEYQDGDAVQG